MSDFCLLVTSRGRPDNWARLLAALEETVAVILDVWLIVDLDDPTVHQYLQHLPRRDEIRLRVVEGPRLGHIGSLDKYGVEAAEKYRIVGQMGDDHVPRTLGWDIKIRDALERPGIAYGDDLYQGRHLPTAVFISAQVIKAAGRFAPAVLWHLYADNYWRDLGTGAGCLRYLPEVVIEHLHFINGKSTHDLTYEESNNTAVMTRDRERWEQFRKTELPRDISNVRAAL